MENYFFIVPPGEVSLLPDFSAVPAVGAPELLASPGFGAIPVALGLEPFVIAPPLPPVVLPFIDPLVVVPLAAGPPAAELPPADPLGELPVCATAKVVESAMTDASTATNFILFPLQ